MDDNVVIEHHLESLTSERFSLHLAHVLCEEGSCRFKFNHVPFTLEAGDVMIIVSAPGVRDVETSEDFRCRIIYVSPEYIELSTPRSNYGMKGGLALYRNPVMKLSVEEFEICRRDFDEVERRFARTGHHFYKESLTQSLSTLFLDFYDFHARIYEEDETIPQQAASLMDRFIALLEEGNYREHREVSWYASELCVTSKYLSEVSKKVSGYSANYWINRHTIQAIAACLRDQRRSFVDIADEFGFSNPAYFTRYVQRYLSISPSDFRK